MTTLTLYGVSWKMSGTLLIRKVVVIRIPDGPQGMDGFGHPKPVKASRLFLSKALTNYK